MDKIAAHVAEQYAAKLGQQPDFDFVAVQAFLTLVFLQPADTGFIPQVLRFLSQFLITPKLVL